MKKAYCSYLVINPIFKHISNFNINWSALSWYSKVCWGGRDSSAMCSSLFPASKAHLWMRSLGDTGGGGSCPSHFHLHPKDILLEKVGDWEVWTKECDLMQCLCIISAWDRERCNFSSIRQNFIWDHDYKVAGSKTFCFSWHFPLWLQLLKEPWNHILTFQSQVLIDRRYLFISDVHRRNLTLHKPLFFPHFLTYLHTCTQMRKVARCMMPKATYNKFSLI